MIHLNGCLSLKCTKINFMSRVSLHVHCKMCRTQKEVNVNASQMIFNFSDVFKCWTFIVRLMRESERSLSIKCMSRYIMLSRAGSYCLRQLAGRALYCQAFVLPSSCDGGIPAALIRPEGYSLDLILNYSSVEMLIIFCEQSVSENPLRHHGLAGGSLGAFFCFFWSAPQKDSLDRQTLPASNQQRRSEQAFPTAFGSPAAGSGLGEVVRSWKTQIWLPEVQKSILAPGPHCYLAWGAFRKVSVWNRVNLNCNFILS